MDGQIPRSGPCQARPERVAKALFRDRPDLIRTHPGPLKPKCTSENAPVAQLDRAPDYESGGQEFESLRARHFYARARWIADSEHVHEVGEIRHKSPIDAWDGGFAPGLDPARRDAGQALRRCPRLLGSRLQSRCSAAPARSRWPFGLSMHGSFNSDDTTGTNR